MFIDDVFATIAANTQKNGIKKARGNNRRGSWSIEVWHSLPFYIEWEGLFNDLLCLKRRLPYNSFGPFAPREVSVLAELVLEHLRYVLTDRKMLGTLMSIFYLTVLIRATRLPRKCSFFVMSLLGICESCFEKIVCHLAAQARALYLPTCVFKQQLQIKSINIIASSMRRVTTTHLGTYAKETSDTSTCHYMPVALQVIRLKS